MFEGYEELNTQDVERMQEVILQEYQRAIEAGAAEYADSADL